MSKRPLSARERAARQAASMLPGAAGGRSSLVKPVPTRQDPAVPQRASIGLAPDAVFHMAGALALSPANVGRKKFRRPVSTLLVQGTLDVAGTSNTVVTFYKNGSSIGTLTFGSGDTDEPTTITEEFDGVDDYLQAKVTTVGTGTPEELVVEVWGT